MQNDLISGKKLITSIKRQPCKLIDKKQYIRLDAVLEKVRLSPTIDAVPVVHARWVKAHGMMPPEYHHRKQCSLCGGWALQDYFGRERMSHFCPNCGAKMDGGAADA